MDAKSSTPTPRSTAAELWMFFRQWIRRPLSTAAVSPSSRFLARRIVAAVPSGTQRVIELGPGTGTFTRALFDHGIAANDLLAVEFNPELHAYLRAQMPQLRVLLGDARLLPENAEVRQFVEEGPVQAVVSGLGLLAMPKDSQQSILAGAFDLMGDDGLFIQFTYGPVAPVHAEVMQALGLSAERHGFTLLNFPPASVYVFRRQRAGRSQAA